jgi:hypothetical protein
MELLVWVCPILSFSSLALGLFFYLRPKQVIDLQIKFYAMINWRMEPISWGKEIRNTRWMGLSVIILAFVAFVYMGLYG